MLFAVTKIQILKVIYNKVLEQEKIFPKNKEVEKGNCY